MGCQEQFMKRIFTAITIFIITAANLFAVTSASEIDAAADKIMPKVVEWRRHLHKYPELGNR
jgi:hypothetical protein